jgi:hypothetical protein
MTSSHLKSAIWLTLVASTAALAVSGGGKPAKPGKPGT